MIKNENNTIELQSIVIKTEGLAADDIDEDKVMLDIKKGKYYGLNKVAARIWEIIEEPSKVETVVDILLSEYEVEEKKCKETVTVFLNKLNIEGLINVYQD